MKMNSWGNGWRRAGVWLAALAVVTMIAGCATHRVNWTARIGQYTFDQAVAELGPPDKQARLNDGTVIAEWLTRRGYRTAYVSPGYYGWRYYYGPSYTETYSPDYFLRLVFGTDNVLKGWKRFSR